MSLDFFVYGLEIENTYFMRLKRGELRKRFAAFFASVRALSSVKPLVFTQTSWPGELLGTQLALVRFLTTVNVFMLDKIK